MARPVDAPRRIPGWAWKALRLPGRHLPVRKPHWFWGWRIWRLGLKPQRFEMFDDVNLSLIPVDAKAVAGYVDGKWPTYSQLAAKFPHARYRVSIAVFAKDDASVLDVEPGDATVEEAVAWIRRQHQRGVDRPAVYTSVSSGNKLVSVLSQAGLVYGKDYLWWSAHYTYKPHLCGPACGFALTHTAHATQWTDKASGKSLDESVCSAEFFS